MQEYTKGTILMFIILILDNPMQSSNPNDMNIVERVVAPCPPFFKKLRNIGLILGGVSVTILKGGAALPAVVIAIDGYLATASAVAVMVSQCTMLTSHLMWSDSFRYLVRT